MSDETIHDGGLDAVVVERLLEELAQGGDIGPGGEEPEGRLRREYLELFGLVGAAVEPVDPPAGVKARLLAAVGGTATVAPATPEPETSRTVPLRPAARDTGLDTGVGTGVGMGLGTGRRWALPLAASLALLLAAFSAYQAVQLAGQRATIDQLSHRLEDIEARTPTVEAMRARLAEARERLQLITGRGVEICALRPMAAESRRANSRGILYVAPDHQHWYLTIEDLMPCRQGRSYQLWFVPAEGEPVSAGTFDVGDGVRVELSSDSMPAATRAIIVTMEPVGGSPQPTGPAVLHGDEVMAVL